MGGRMALTQSGLPSLSMAASTSPGVGMVSASSLTALVSSSGVSAGPVGADGSPAPNEAPASASARPSTAGVRSFLLMGARYGRGLGVVDGGLQTDPQEGQPLRYCLRRG